MYQVESLPEWPRADYFKVQSEDGSQYLRDYASACDQRAVASMRLKAEEIAQLSVVGYSGAVPETKVL